MNQARVNRRRDRLWIWRSLATGVALILLLGACSQKINADEAAKADELRALTQPLGIEITDGLASSLYATDGGFICGASADPDDLIESGVLVSHRFALRKLEVTAKAVGYTEAVVQVYCPENAENLEKYIDDLVVEGRS